MSPSSKKGNFKEKVSIIVPVFNSSRYIDRCINSLISQTYENIEIIIVDDESTDETISKCSKFASIYSFIKFYPISHSGISSVRNTGLNHVTGDYIMFVDGDDYVKNNYVESMVNAIKSAPGCDMAICSYDRVIYDRLYPIKNLQNTGIISKNRYLINTLKDPGHHYFGVVWNKIFKSRLITDNNITFSKDITLGEDFVFSLNYLKYAENVNVIVDKLYYYCYHHNNTLSRITNKSISDCESEMSNRNKIFSNYIDSMEAAGLYDKYKKHIYHYWIVFYIRQNYSLREEYGWSSSDTDKWIREMLQNTNIIKALDLYSKRRVRVEFLLYFITQSSKNFIKKTIRFINRKKRIAAKQ